MFEKIYIWLLKLYPAAFRAEYRAAALQLFRDRFHAERGLLARCRLWFDLIVDLAVSIPREYGRRGRLAGPQAGGYRLSEEAIAAMMDRWKSRLTVMLYFYTAVLLGAGIGWVGEASRPPLLATYGLLAALGTLRYYQRTNRFKRDWRGYELIVGTDRVQEKRAGVHSVTVLKWDVTGLIDCEGGLGILTGDPRPAILVRSDLIGYEQIREHLASWMPITRPDCLKHDDPRTGRQGQPVVSPAGAVSAMPGRHDHRPRPAAPPSPRRATRSHLSHALECLIIVSYVPALLVRSHHWFLPLALLSTAWLYIATSRQRRERRSMKGAIIPLVAIVPLVAKAIALLRL